MEVLPQLRGAFSLTFMDEDTLYAARDPQGVRPLVLGRLERGWVVASETAALDIVRRLRASARSSRASSSRSTRTGCAASTSPPPSPRAASSSTSTWPARTPRSPAAACTPPASRSAAGWPRSTRSRPTWSSRCRSRARRPPSATPRPRGIPYGLGLVKNSYVGRTFIQPSQTIRQLGIRLKLNPLRDVIRGKRLVVVDDSIVRGNTQRALIRMLREAGAVEVHVRIASPPVKWPCFYGIDFASRAELDRQRPGRRRRPRLDQRRLAGLRLRAGPDRRDRAAGQPAVHRVLHRPVPDPAGRVRGAGQARARGHRPPRSGEPGRRHRLDRSAGRQRHRAGRAPEDALARP